MEKLVVYTQPTDPITEAYRVLCTNVMAGLGEKKLIEVVGISTNAGAGLVAANLAVAMAQAGHQTLVMDCNLRSPEQHLLFGLPNRGITEYLVSATSFTDFVQHTAQQNLQLLTAGTAVLNPVETLLSVPMKKLLNDVKAAYDVIILCVPVTGNTSDAIALGTLTDGAVLVIADKEDRVETALRTKESFIQADVDILGCILNKVK